MTVRVRRSARGDADMQQIATYLVEENPAAARRFLEALQDAQARLAEFPNIGQPGPLPGARRLVVGRYIVHYRRRGDAVEVFAVRRAARRDSREPR